MSRCHANGSLPHHSCQVTPGSYSNVTACQCQCLGFEVLGHALSIQPNCPTTENCFLGQVVIQVRGGKKFVHIQFMAKSFYPPCQISHCCMCCCQVLKTVAKVGVASVCLLCCQRRNFSPRRCLNPLRFLVFDSETGEPVSHAKFHFPLRNTNCYW